MRPVYPQQDTRTPSSAMSFPGGFGSGQPHYSPLDGSTGSTFQSPATFSQPFFSDQEPVQSPAIEMRPGVQHRQSSQSLSGVGNVSGISGITSISGVRTPETPQGLPPNTTSRPPLMHHDSRQSAQSMTGARTTLPAHESAPFDSSHSVRPAPSHGENGRSNYSTGSTVFSSPGESVSSLAFPIKL